MTTEIELPHRLGREEARRRIRARIGELPAHVPGGMAEVESRWIGEDRMELGIAALGQRVAAALIVEEDRVRIRLDLPPMLRFAGGAIEAAVRSKGGQLLLGEPPAA